MRGLYAIVDATTLSRLSLPIVEVACALAAARPAALQLRAKDASPRETLAWLRAIAPACRQAGVPLFANDRADLAALAGCDGVHVGQTDLPPSVVRRIAPQLKVGLSTHTLEQVERGLVERPDYIAFGPVFETASKSQPDPVVGLDALAMAARASTVPVVAIGGIDAARAPLVARVAHAAAMISALIPEGASAKDLAAFTSRARAMHLALSGPTLHDARA